MRIKWRKATAIIAAVTVPGLATAQDCAKDLKTKLESAGQGEGFAILADCIAQQASIIDQLKANSVPAVGNHENTRAIIAYYSDKG